MIELDFMTLAVDLALRGYRSTKTNPMVGAVIVYENKIIGRGYHKKFGDQHAEVNALHSVSSADKHLIPLSTLYVTLEPCSHYGKTPPCADAIISAGIKKVIVGQKDPNPLVSGNGIQKMKRAGIEVVLLEDRQDTFDLIRPFKAHLQKRPYIILKCVKSKDHFIGKKGESIWLSSPVSRALAHVWRRDADGILVGKNTVLSDNPQLNVREVEGNDPVRILIDPKLSCPSDSFIFNKNGKVIVANTSVQKSDDNIEFLKINDGEVFLINLLEALFERNIYTLLVEGGAFTLQKFIDASLWDEARIIDCPARLKEGIKAPDIEGTLSKKTKIGNDVLTVVYPLSNPFPHQESL